MHPYSSINTTAAWRKLCFILLVRSHFHMTDSLLIAFPWYLRSTFRLVSSTFYLISRNFYLVPSTFYLVSSNFYLISGTFYLVSSTCYLVSSTFYLVSGTFYLLSSTFYLVCSTFHLISSTFYTLPFIFYLSFAKQLESSSEALETRVQSQAESYQRLKKWYLMPPCLTLCTIKYESRVKWSNPGKRVVPFPTLWCCSYWKGSLWVTLDYGRQLYLLIYPFTVDYWVIKRESYKISADRKKAALYIDHHYFNKERK